MRTYAIGSSCWASAHWRLVLLPWSPSRPGPGGGGRQNRGQRRRLGVLRSEKELNTALKKQGKTTFKGDGAWNLNMMVFLGSGSRRRQNQHRLLRHGEEAAEQVNFNEIGVEPDQKIVQLNGISISKDMGFVKGHKYEVRATRLIGGKEKVYAKTTITLR